MGWMGRGGEQQSEEGSGRRLRAEKRVGSGKDRGRRGGGFRCELLLDQDVIVSGQWTVDTAVALHYPLGPLHR